MHIWVFYHYSYKLFCPSKLSVSFCRQGNHERIFTESLTTEGFWNRKNLRVLFFFYNDILHLKYLTSSWGEGVVYKRIKKNRDSVWRRRNVFLVHLQKNQEGKVKLKRRKGRGNRSSKSILKKKQASIQRLSYSTE